MDIINSIFFAREHMGIEEIYTHIFNIKIAYCNFSNNNRATKRKKRDNY
jgi:hypothetical protein